MSKLHRLASQSDRSSSAPPLGVRAPASPPTHAHSPVTSSPLAAQPSPLALDPSTPPTPLSGSAVRRSSASEGVGVAGPSKLRAAIREEIMAGRAGSGSGSGKGKSRAVSVQERLRNEVDGVVKRRTGGVLGRGFILKTDHYPTGRALDLDLTIQGAPNFRAPYEESLNVYGSAQPTVTGLKSILTLLGCQPNSVRPPQGGSFRSNEKPRSSGRTQSTSDVGLYDSPPLDTVDEESSKAVWFSTREETLIYCNGRPYVLRDASDPFRTLALSDRASNLEDIERRLKVDILAEARRYGGLILTHDEVSNGELVPTWMAVDEESIQTPKEVAEQVMHEGWRVAYWRIPIAPDTPIEDNYLDAYVQVLKEVNDERTSLIFNCGMGVVRTTFGMCAALLVRRKQMMLRGVEDPFHVNGGGSGLTTPAPGPQMAQFLEQANLQQNLNKALLRLTRVLDRNLPSKQSAIDVLASHPDMLDSLRKAHMGNYQMVLSLLSSLDNGRQMKRLVDRVIDSCDAVINLRENVIAHRIKYSVTAMDDKNRQNLLDKALRSLEQYFDLIVFAAYVEEEDAGDTGVTFSSWLKRRQEIWNQIKIIRRPGGNRLFAFAPANDLSLISRTTELTHGRHSTSRDHKQDVDLSGGKVLGDEWAEHVVSNRSGIMLRASTLLKSDLWLVETATSTEGVRGAVGFRKMRGDNAVYATGQPTQDAIAIILRKVKERSPHVTKVIWVCLREEPLVMINGSPFCLRKGSSALRNMRDYTGVSASRLEVLEDRLKSDVINELAEFQGRVLLHSETTNGEVIPVWESVDKSDIKSIREIMDEERNTSTEVDLDFVRIPVTSESTPDFHDITELLDLCMHTDSSSSAFILSDQLGRGRSSTTAVIVLLIQRWLQAPVGERQTAGTSGTSLSVGVNSRDSPLRRRTSFQIPNRQSGSRTSWQIINSCLRVIRNGLEVKQAVDEAIDQTASHFNLRDAIEDFRQKAEECGKGQEEERNSNVEKGLFHLRRYFHLLVFQAYLDQREPDDAEPYSFESFVKHRPVFKTLETELEEGGIKSLTPLDRVDPAQGMALPDEVASVVANRSGAILSAQTILKSDLFLGLQKQSLPERVDGAPNYRKAPIEISPPSMHSDVNGIEHSVYGTGMPSALGLRNALAKMHADPSGSRHILWTSLREEPVLYVKGRPHVLRLLDKPMANVETTGVSAHVVERMEQTLKDDVLAELKRHQGQLLLHDEVETKPGQYEIVPIWELVEEEDIRTPREIYEVVQKQGYKVDYERVAITDEQAPLPASLQSIVSRVAKGLHDDSSDFVFNCQMGRGRTTTGMITACLIASIAQEDMEMDSAADLNGTDPDGDMSGEAAQYLNGEYKTILQLVTVLSHGKQAKRLTDAAVNQMEGVQNIRKAVYDFKLMVDASEPGSPKEQAQRTRAVNYLYRYGTLIVLANFLLEAKAAGTPLSQTDFPSWMQQHREIRTVLSRKALD